MVEKILIKYLKLLGIKKNDNVYLSINFFSLLISFYEIDQKINKKKLNESIYYSIAKLIGDKGNIFVPTYSFTFKSKKNHNIYDKKKTKSKLGEFSNYFLKLKKVVRSNDPVVSIAGIGPDVKKVLLNNLLKSYGKNTFWYRFNKLKNAKILNIGLGNFWIPFIHQVEYEANVCYRSEILFFGRRKINNKVFYSKWLYYGRTTISKNSEIHIEKAYKKINKKNFINKNFKRTNFSCYSSVKVYNNFLKKVKKDKNFLLKN